MSFRFLAFAGVFAVATSFAGADNQLEVSNAGPGATQARPENGAAYVTIVSPEPPTGSSPPPRRRQRRRNSTPWRWRAWS